MPHASGPYFLFTHRRLSSSDLLRSHVYWSSCSGGWAYGRLELEVEG